MQVLLFTQLKSFVTVTVTLVGLPRSSALLPKKAYSAVISYFSVSELHLNPALKYVFEVPKLRCQTLN